MLESFFADVRYAGRWLVKTPGFAIVAVASFTIGIGFNTALFAVVDAALFRPLPVSRPAELVDVYTSSSENVASERFGTSSYPDYLDLKARNQVFTDLIGYSPMFGALNLGDRSRLTLGEMVSGNYFTTLGVHAAIGRTLLPEDDAPGAPRVAMVSHRYWIRELASTPSLAGQTLKLRGVTYAIAGVAPSSFSGMTSVLSPDVWVPITTLEVEPIGMRDVTPSPTGSSRLDRRGERWLFVKGRLRPELTVAHAGANLNVLMAALEAANPITNKGRRATVKATNAVHFHPAADPTLVPVAFGIMAVVGLVLLIACANVASMLLARASARQKEIGVRLALGASRGRLVRQLITESVVLSALGAVAGIACAWAATRLLASISLPIAIPLSFDFRIDARAVTFTAGATMIAGVLAGLAPALKASRPNFASDLRGEAVVSNTGGRRWTLRDVLVAGQIAITALLLVVAALLTRSLIAEQNATLGFPVERIALVSLDSGMVNYSDAKSHAFFDDALARIRAIPGVEAAALTTRPPFSPNWNRWNIWIDGRPRPDDRGDTVEVTTVSPDYFKTIGIPILQGRAIGDEDRPDAPFVAVINETFARKFWPGESAIGRTFHSRGPDGPVFTIVGVAADHKVTSVGEAPTPFLHLARAQRPNSYTAIVARTRGDANALVSQMRRELLAIEPNLVFVENQTMAAELAATLFPARAGAWLVGIIGAIAMALAAVGLYGVIAYSVARRTREIGIRIALGAEPASVLRLVMRQGLGVAAAGVALGLVMTAGLAALIELSAPGTLRGALYGIGPMDPPSWLGAATLLIAVSALANLIPARRAARVAPSTALRVE